MPACRIHLVPLLALSLGGCRSTPSQPTAPEPPARDIAEMSARIDDLSQQVARLTSTLTALSASRATPRPASFTAEPLSAHDQRSIETLRDALTTLEEQSAIHVENIANASAHGYKRRVASVRTRLDGPDQRPTTVLEGVTHSMAQGPLESTGEQLDLGIEGSGFLQFQKPNGEHCYSRDGRLLQDPNGRMVSPRGHLLTDAVVIPRDCEGVSFTQDGQAFALGENNTLTAIGTIRLHTFPNPSELKLDVDGGFLPTPASGDPQARQPGTNGAGWIRQGYLEGSNVKAEREMIDLQLVEIRANAIRRSLEFWGVQAL